VIAKNFASKFARSFFLLKKMRSQFSRYEFLKALPNFATSATVAIARLKITALTII
jgi:hypothetical protein